MKGKHTTKTKASKKTSAVQPAPVREAGITRADVRRSTYSPTRPAGVHARELGLGTKRS